VAVRRDGRDAASRTLVGGRFEAVASPEVAGAAAVGLPGAAGAWPASPLGDSAPDAGGSEGAGVAAGTGGAAGADVGAGVASGGGWTGSGGGSSGTSGSVGPPTGGSCAIAVEAEADAAAKMATASSGVTIARIAAASLCPRRVRTVT
jgi:hypothetical protein